MKTLLLTLFSTLMFGHSYSQNKLDSTWAQNGQTFRVLLVENEEATNDINTKISLYRNNQLIKTDSITCVRLHIERKDMNQDGFDDLLVYQSSGARANELFNLFLFTKSNNDLIKVEGFNQWPNLDKTELKGILAATILTGTVSYKFFQLKDSGELIDLKVSETDELLDGKPYERGIRKVKRLKKYSAQHRL